MYLNTGFPPLMHATHTVIVGVLHNCITAVCIYMLKMASEWRTLHVAELITFVFVSDFLSSHVIS